MEPFKKADVVAQLQQDILRLQGFRSSTQAAADMGLGSILDALPNAAFPVGAVHEFISATYEDQAAAGGFVAGLLASLLGRKGTMLWISSCRTVFPPALKNFGIEPDHVIFIDLQKEKHVLWAMEEALKCGALTAVVGELREIDFTASRRLQLAVEQSQVTGFIIRRNHKMVNTTACISRWKISSLPSEAIQDLPGVGSPAWCVELLRIRNGKPGAWKVAWVNKRFLTRAIIPEKALPAIPSRKQLKTG